MRVHPDPFQTWTQIQGNNPRHASAGYTSAASPSTSGQLTAEELLQRPHDAYKVLCLNEDQEALLSNDIPFLIFLNDFGAGKIYITVKSKQLITELSSFSIY